MRAVLGTLAWVGLVASDADAVARALARDFGLPRADTVAGATGRRVPLLGVGRAALALFEPGDPFLGDDARPGVHHLALAVADLAGAAARATAAGVRLEAPDPVAGLGGARHLRLAPATTAGVRTYLTEPVPAAPPARGPGAAGWVERIDHVGVATADTRGALECFVTRLGFPLESTQTDVEAVIAVESFTSDRYGVVYHARPPEVVGGLRVAFVTVGDAELEFLEDLDPRAGREPRPAPGASGAGTTRGDRTAIARFVAARGPGLHHLALKVDDVDGALGRLAAAGYELIDRVGRPGSRRARIAFLGRARLGGVLVHLVERPAA